MTERFEAIHPDYVLVDPTQKDDVERGAMTDSGIFLPETQIDDRTDRGTVLLVGDEVVLYQPGDYVMFSRTAGTEIFLGGEKRLLLQQKSLYGKLATD